MTVRPAGFELLLPLLLVLLTFVVPVLLLLDVTSVPLLPLLLMLLELLLSPPLLLLLLQKSKEMLDSMARVLKPLVDQLAAVETINAPDFLSYSTWLANQAAVKQRWDGEGMVVVLKRKSSAVAFHSDWHGKAGKGSRCSWGTACTTTI